jgi:hypothetical protein
MPVTAFHGNGLVSRLEILRGDLVDVLYQATKGQTDYRFDTRITELSQNGDAVEATLTDGTKLSVDLVVGADGPHSTVRRLVFGREEQFAKPLVGYNAWFTAPDAVGLDGWYLMYQVPGLNASIRPSHEPSMCKAGLAFRSETHRLRPPKLQRATGFADKTFRRCGLAVRRVACGGRNSGGLLLRYVRASTHADDLAGPGHTRR